MDILCCPECLWELFVVYEDGSVCCAECGCEIDIENDDEKQIIVAH